MKPAHLKYGDTIGIISPCHFAEKERYQNFINGIENLGFTVKEGRNLYKRTYGYAASEKERLDDLMQMVEDDEVKMILFGGGNVGNEFIADIDFEVIKSKPKIICSYSNGTTLLDIIYLQTGMRTYYGQFPGIFAQLSQYDKQHFLDMFIKGETAFYKKSRWKTLVDGSAEGVLIGGYTTRIAMLLGSPYFTCDKSKEYILFLENNERFNSVGAIAEHLAHIEQSAFMQQVRGLLFGNYSESKNPELIDMLKRFGLRNHIPVLKCDDFGHGVNHGILPIGQKACLDGATQNLFYLT